METVFEWTARLVVTLAVCANALFAQAQTQGPAKPAGDCPDMAEAKARLEAQEKRLKDWPELARYRDANASVAAPAKNEQRVVFMGDSITDAWVQPRFGAFFPGKPYIGRGISGQTTPQMLLRFRADVIALQPKVVVILAGTNDLAGNTGLIALEETEGNLASMAELARANGIRVVLSSVLPVSNYGRDRDGNPLDVRIKRPPERILELNAWIRKYAAANDHVHLDYFPAMVDEHGLLKKELSDDGLHPNAAGYAVMAPLAEKAIQSALREMPASGFGFQSPVPVAKQTEQEIISELYGLYYVDLGDQEIGETALVISPDGRPIPKKENDPEAPTLPGFHFHRKHFKFAWSQFSPQGFAFRTVSIDGVAILHHELAAVPGDVAKSVSEFHALAPVVCPSWAKGAWKLSATA
ncbi:MAG TPA: SGNH/GDSL hydrolase family protein [Candidatus Acidoferrales bacterium]|nr:SGNH/GDSL hydrolase family protein [Candidatus Acidoferrales bacterium]